MPNWKNEEDYKFADSLDRSGWAWEFMRRNADYKADWIEAGNGGVIYQPPKKEGESDRAWVARIIVGGGVPLKAIKTVAFARKWRMIPPILDPNGSNTPRYDLAYPKLVGIDQLDEYFNDNEPHSLGSDFAVLAFDLTRPLQTQIESATGQLKQWSKEKMGNNSEFMSKPKNISIGKWKIFLRLLDAEGVGAKPKDIRNTMNEYHPATNDANAKKISTDRFSDHRDRAHSLRDNPLSILS